MYLGYFPVIIVSISCAGYWFQKSICPPKLQWDCSQKIACDKQPLQKQKHDPIKLYRRW